VFTKIRIRNKVCYKQNIFNKTRKLRRGKQAIIILTQPVYQPVENLVVLIE